MDQEKLAKLPKWAQQEILSLERSRQGWKDRCEQLSGKYPDSNVQVSNHIYGDMTLPRDSEVDFYLGDPPYRKYQNMIDVQLLRTKDRKLIRVSTSGLLAVYPGASNTVELGIANPHP